MADIYYIRRTPEQEELRIKLIDNGDGTYSEAVSVALDATDVEIGAVELKDGTTDTRAVVGADGLEVQGIADRLVPNATEADQALTVAAAAGGVQFSAFHANTTHVFFTTEAADVRVTFDGSAPTTTNGHLIPSGSNGIWTKAMAAAAKFIRTAAVSAVISSSQLKVG